MRHDEHARRQELIVAALQAEIEALDAQISKAKQESSQAQDSALCAAALAFGDEWNRLAKQLVAVGSRILAADHHRGSGHDVVRPVDPALRPLSQRGSTATTC